ncbi:D-cysteine desulfhydrase [Dyadobacter sp. CECT 9275]|uniref:D-cysteine desulfhydrase n=1 Tax=Dyadobacter helix TaxID=2822344 RepID=A0A916N5A8_9BACT|nr:pyridoxal-phosphate dependent enzyme [Dyadobacter sp. CECT 9275]CAG5004280.1 D-cysteine desulfhydrase [Dyadobacter sp. CECT 9275]
MDLLTASLPTPLQEISDDIIKNARIRLFVKRDDLIHPLVSGNKWRKLKYNLLAARQTNSRAILTFGGVFSNHLFAVAAAGRILGLSTIGIVRGEEHTIREVSPTLAFCREQGMVLQFVSRQEYRQRSEAEYLRDVSKKWDEPFIIPEGGTSPLALKGVNEMVMEVSAQLGHSPDYYAVAAGTGGTSAGILSVHEKVIAFSALKGGDFLRDDILALAGNSVYPEKLILQTGYHFGGYGKWKPELITFINTFKQKHGIQLEQVYTGKMFFGLYELILQHYFVPGTTIVAVHTGGLQGLLPEFTVLS